MHSIQADAQLVIVTGEQVAVATEPCVSFAGNLTDDPEVRYTESGIARAVLPSVVVTMPGRS